MVTTVTLSPCIDLTVRVPALKPGALNLAEAARSDLAGKGINVSVVLRALGVANQAAGICFDADRERLAAHLTRHCIHGRFVPAHGSLRTNIKLYDEAGALTEINHAGQPVAPFVLREYLRVLRDCAERSDVVVFSGRLPAGADPALYRQSMAAIAGLPVKVVVDAEGRPLREALRRRPYLIKPNRHELATTFGCAADSLGEVLAACRRITARGVALVCVSLGEAGAVLADAREAWFAPPLAVEVRGLQGAGDSMVAGLCRGIMEGAALPQMLAYGVAAASASLLREGTQLCRPRDFERLLPLVQVKQLDENGGLL